MPTQLQQKIISNLFYLIEYYFNFKSNYFKCLYPNTHSHYITFKMVNHFTHFIWNSQNGLNGYYQTGPILEHGLHGDTWLAMGVTWNPFCGAAQTRETAPSEQPSLGDGRPSPLAKHSAINDFGPINLQPR